MDINKHRYYLMQVLLAIQKSVSEYAQECAEKVRNFSPRALMQGLGEVLISVKGIK